MNILFVCTGNTCRSPMAEGFMNKIASEQGLDIKAQSAGIFAAVGEQASDNAVLAASELGADISNHKARSLDEDMLRDNDLILTMTSGQKEILAKVVEDKLYTVGEYAGEDTDIPDPYGGDEEEYRITAQAIMEAVKRIADRLK